MLCDFLKGVGLTLCSVLPYKQVVTGSVCVLLGKITKELVWLLNENLKKKSSQRTSFQSVSVSNSWQVKNSTD